MKIKIITDSSCDLAPGVKEQFGIGVIPLYINIGDKSYVDGVDITREEFYTNLTSYEHYPKTAAPSPETFKEYYHQAAEDGYEAVFSIHVSGRLSATINSAHMAAKEFNEIPVHVIDSQNLSAGAGYVVQQAAQTALAGKTDKEVVAAIEDIMPRVYTFAIIDNLDHLKHSGRIAQFVTTLSSALKIRIMLKMNRGQPGAEQFRTMLKGMHRLEELAEKLQPFQEFVYLHTNNPQAIEQLSVKVNTILDDSVNPLLLPVNPVLGSHLGDTAYGFSCVTVEQPQASVFTRSLEKMKKAARSVFGEQEET
jgi:DegV family protein with EDD domain